MAGWLNTTFAALGFAPFRVLWFGTICSHLAFFMSTVVQSVVAFELIGSNTAVGSVVFAQGLAQAFLQPLGGALADRWPKRRVIAISQSVPATVFLALAYAYWSGVIHIGWVTGGSFMIGLTFAFLGPARQALVIDLVPSASRGNAVALAQVASTVSQMLGPGLAGILLVSDRVGPGGAYATMGSLYVFSTLLLILLPASRRREGAGDTKVLDDVLDGVRYVFQRPSLRSLVLLYVGVIMVGFPYVTVMPGLVENVLQRDAEAYAFLSLMAAVGAFAASVAVARFADHPRAVVIFGSMGVLFGAALIGLSQIPSYGWATVAMLPVGFGFGGFMTLNGAVIVRSTDPNYFGRVMSLTMLAFGWFGLMGLPIGMLADAIGERGALRTMGFVVLGFVALFGFFRTRR